MAKLKGVVYDIDDTLYLEREYVFSGFWEIAKYLSQGKSSFAEKIFQFMWSCFENGIRGNIFDLLFDNYPNIAREYKIEDLIRIYREHKPNIELPFEMKDLLEYLLHNGFFLAVISDGPISSQNNKVNALELENYFKEIVLTDIWGKEYWKPHSRAFTYLENKSGLSPQQLVYVADNPEKDFTAPNKRGWNTIRINIPGQQKYNIFIDNVENKSKYLVTSYLELKYLLFNINSI